MHKIALCEVVGSRIVKQTKRKRKKRKICLAHLKCYVCAHNRTIFAATHHKCTQYYVFKSCCDKLRVYAEKFWFSFIKISLKNDRVDKMHMSIELHACHLWCGSFRIFSCFDLCGQMGLCMCYLNARVHYSRLILLEIRSVPSSRRRSVARSQSLL